MIKKYVKSCGTSKKEIYNWFSLFWIFATVFPQYSDFGCMYRQMIFDLGVQEFIANLSRSTRSGTSDNLQKLSENIVYF
jgi:hypothetical protein